MSSFWSWASSILTWPTNWFSRNGDKQQKKSPKFNFNAPNCSLFVLTRRSSLYIDEDGDSANEFYEQVYDIPTGKLLVKRVTLDITEVGTEDLPIPTLHPSLPVAFLEPFVIRRGRHELRPKPTPAGHVPVLCHEVVECLTAVIDKQQEPIVVDMTFGCGGHSSAILNRWPQCRLICLDRDPSAFERCKALQTPKVTPLLGRFRDLPSLLPLKDTKVDAVLFDLGVSSPQFDDPSRGFCLSVDGPLDMRMDGDRSNDLQSASDVVNQLPVSDLSQIIKIYGEEKNSDEIARAIVDYRNSRGPITRTLQLAAIIQAVSPGAEFRRDKLNRYSHPATRTFQALRIFVNDELNDLCHGLDVAHDLLKPSGRCLVISFHSLEDRIVKRIFHAVKIRPPAGVDESHFHSRLRTSTEPLSSSQMAAILSRKWKPIAATGGGLHIVPGLSEVDANPRARSAKLRVAEKIVLF